MNRAHRVGRGTTIGIILVGFFFSMRAVLRPPIGHS
jgi:hypothetical protein